MRKSWLTILIFLSFSLIIILPSFLTICSNNVHSVQKYIVNNQLCSHKDCLNGILLQYFHIRTKILQTTTEIQLIAVVAFGLLLLFIKRKFLIDKKLILGKLYIKQKFKNSSSNLFNSLLLVFFNGILHPKIY